MVMLITEDAAMGLEPYFSYADSRPYYCTIYGKRFPTEEIEALLALNPNIHWQYVRRSGNVRAIKFEPNSIATYDIPLAVVFEYDAWLRAIVTLLEGSGAMVLRSE